MGKDEFFLLQGPFRVVLQKIPDHQAVFLRVNGTGGINQPAARLDGRAVFYVKINWT